MKISVVTATFNSAATIVDTLDSVALQSHPDVEHIIVDGASRDNTVSLIRERGARVAKLVTEADNGIYDAMNKGIAMATGDVVGFLNSDDIYADDKVLERIAQSFLDPQIDAVYGDLVFVAQDDVGRVVRYWKSRPYTPRSCERGWMPPHPTFYVRRSIYGQYGGFDLSFPVAADFEMALRLLDKAGIRSRHIPEVLVRMRMGGESTGSPASILAQNLEASRACRKHGLTGGAQFVLRKILAKIPQLMRRPSAPT